MSQSLESAKEPSASEKHGGLSPPPQLMACGPERTRAVVGRSLNVPVLLLWFTAPVLILLAASLLNTGDQRQVLLPWSGIVMPETCALHARFGLDCPGCGLTRSFIHIAHGSPLRALALHPLSWFVFAYIALQIPMASLHALGYSSVRLQRWTRFNEWALIGLIIALVVQWVVRLLLGWL